MPRNPSVSHDPSPSASLTRNRPQKQCGHHECLLNTPRCCHCSDLRPAPPPGSGYPVYIDGRGFTVRDNARDAMYCTACRRFSEVDHNEMHQMRTQREEERRRFLLSRAARAFNYANVASDTYVSPLEDLFGDAEQPGTDNIRQPFADSEGVIPVGPDVITSDSTRRYPIVSANGLPEPLDRNAAHISSIPDGLTSQQLLCAICYSSQRSALLLPCRHLALCVNCAERTFAGHTRQGASSAHSLHQNEVFSNSLALLAMANSIVRRSRGDASAEYQLMADDLGMSEEWGAGPPCPICRIPCVGWVRVFLA